MVLSKQVTTGEVSLMVASIPREALRRPGRQREELSMKAKLKVREEEVFGSTTKKI